MTGAPGRALTATITGAGTIVADQASKALADRSHGVPLAYPLRNRGLSLQLVSASPAIEATLMALALIGASCYATPRIRTGAWPPVPAGLLLGGALSNLLDRAFLGSVRDFLLLGPIVINLADLAVITGALLVTLPHSRTSLPCPLTEAR